AGGRPGGDAGRALSRLIGSPLTAAPSRGGGEQHRAEQQQSGAGPEDRHRVVRAVGEGELAGGGWNRVVRVSGGLVRVGGRGAVLPAVDATFGGQRVGDLLAERHFHQGSRDAEVLAVEQLQVEQPGGAAHVGA